MHLLQLRGEEVIYWEKRGVGRESRPKSVDFWHPPPQDVFGTFPYHKNICITCTEKNLSRTHFVQCRVHNQHLTTIITEKEKIGLTNNFPREGPFFFNYQNEIHHPSNVIFISTFHYMYTLRYTLTPPNFDLIRSNIIHFVQMANVMFLLNPNGMLATKLFKH